MNRRQKNNKKRNRHPAECSTVQHKKMTITDVGSKMKKSSAVVENEQEEGILKEKVKRRRNSS